ncbi:MAG: riboflavin synthase [Colwellia sp.]
MFTGIIEAVGTIKAININGQGARLVIATNQLDMSDVKLGDSIAANGICLTVVDYDAASNSGSYSADVSNETLQRTGFAHYTVGTHVNLEKAMLASTRFGGHMVSGHVDGVSDVLSIVNNGNSIEYWLSMPKDLAHYIAEKGSITIDGTSLTVNALSDNKFRLTIVPHTVKETIFAHYQVGTKVNLEVDLIARYLERLLMKETSSETSVTKSNVTESLLQKSGFLR